MLKRSLLVSRCVKPQTNNRISYMDTFEIGDQVVYPNHAVGIIEKIPLGNDSILGDSDAMVGIAMAPMPQLMTPRRHRFQRSSLQKRKSQCGSYSIAFCWQDHRGRSQILGPCSEMSRAEALTAMAEPRRPSMH